MPDTFDRQSLATPTTQLVLPASIQEISASTAPGNTVPEATQESTEDTATVEAIVSTIKPTVLLCGRVEQVEGIATNMHIVNNIGRRQLKDLNTRTHGEVEDASVFWLSPKKYWTVSRKERSLQDTTLDIIATYLAENRDVVIVAPKEYRWCNRDPRKTLHRIDTAEHVVLCTRKLDKLKSLVGSSTDENLLHESIAVCLAQILSEDPLTVESAGRVGVRQSFNIEEGDNDHKGDDNSRAKETKHVFTLKRNSKKKLPSAAQPKLSRSKTKKVESDSEYDLGDHATNNDKPSEKPDYAKLVKKERQNKPVEKASDDCGDTVTAIELKESVEAFAAFLDDDDISTTCSNFDHETTLQEVSGQLYFGSVHELLEFVVRDESFDKVPPQADSDVSVLVSDLHLDNQNRPFFTYNWTPTNHSNHHIHMMEVFGGWGGCTRIAIRKKLRTGQNYDLTTGINLLDKAEVRKLHYYVDQYKPDVIVLAPPCTAFGRWSMYNRVHNWWAWSKSLEVGLPLANLAAALAAQQIKANRYYIAENPWGSQIFELPAWQPVLRQSTMVCCDQCLFGLTDMDGWPTRKSTAFASNDESLINDLNIRCQGQHSYHSVLAGSLHGTSKCSYAQSWPVQLCETIVNAIKRVLVRDGKIYLENSSREFVYVEEKSLSVCAGCRAHAYRGDPRHTRVRGVCKFADFESDELSCPSCKRNQPSHHPNHTKVVGECHWAEAGTRSTSSSSRGPKAISHIIPDAPPDVGSGSNPPETPLGKWYPLTDLSTIAAFDSVKNFDGWHTWYNNDQLLVASNARNLREPQPRFENHLYNTRSIFAFFIEHEHDTGNWWQLEDHLPYMNKSRTLGYPVSILIQIFHVSIGHDASVPPTEKESDVVNLDEPIGGTTTPLEGPIRRRVRINTTPEELAQPAEFGDEELELPDVPVRRAAVEEVSESAIVPAEEKPEELVEWSTADLGNTLREMKSQDNSIVTRALRKLHIRWWHCSATRMRTILAQAGMSEKVLSKIKDVCDTCRICRSWTRPSSKAMSHLTQAAGFNERVQLDLLFIDTYILVHLCDEATRFSMAEVIKTKEPCDILSGIKKAWVRVFGVPQIFISDSEGALGSEEASIWAERLGTSFKLLPKGSHATIVERHHETLRQLIHRIASQLKRENIVMSMEDICAEALVAKNCLLVINGVAPYTAVLGKLPNLLGEFERPPVSMLADDVGGSLSKHTSRLREVAIQQMVEGSAQERIKRAKTSQTRVAGEQLELVPGDLVDIYRTPRQKDNTGWRGPCTVVSTHGVEQGYLDVKWGGRTMACRIQDVRKALLYPALLRNRPDEYALDMLRQHVASMIGVTEIFSMINTQDGWQLSQAARSRPELFHAFLKVAHDLFAVERCIGGRLGKGVARIPGMLDVSHTVLVWWPTNSPQLYKSMTCHGKLTLNLKELFGELWQEFAWIQCFGVNDEDVSRIRQRAPDIPYLGGERGDPRQEPPAQPIPFDVDDEDMPHPRLDDDRSIATRIVLPTPTDRSRPSRNQSPFPSSNGPPAPPAPPPAPQQQRQKRTPTQTDRSRSTRGGESTLSTPQVTPVVSTQSTNKATANTETPELPDTPRGSKRSPTKSREAPLSAKKHYKDNRQERSQSQASSSNAPPTTQHEPILPTHAENNDDDDDDETVAYDNDQDTDLFSVDPWSSMYSQREAPRQYHGWELNPGLSDIVSHQEHYVANSETTTDKLQTRSSSMKDDRPEIEVGPAMAAWFVGVQQLKKDEILVFKSAGDNATSVQIEKNFDALTPAEVKQHYKLVETAIRKEIASFVEHKTFKRAFKKDCKNVCTSRWVLRWKDIDGQRCVKARLTIRGFQDMAEVPSFASTASRWGQRLVVSIASQKTWDLWVADVSTAFLRGLDFNELAKLTNSEVRDVAFIPPKGSERFFTELKGLHDLNFNTEVLKLMKAVYGLRDAPRAWRIRLDAELVKLGGVSLPTDRALYTFYDSANNLDCLLSTHVDDLKGCGTSARVKSILAGLEKAFGKLKTQSLDKDSQFEHCGLKHEKIPSGGIRVHQDHYAAQLKCIDVTSLDITKVDQMLSQEFISLYLSLLGGLSWLIQTRTDIAVYVCALQRAASKATIGHLLKLNKITKWVRRKKIALVYKPLQKRGKVLVVSDSAFRTEPGSTLAVRGAIIGICEDDTNTPGGIFHILEFYSRKQRRVCRSTFAAELHAIADAVETARMVLLTITCCHKRYISPQELQKLEDTASLPLAMEVCTDCRSVFDSLAAQDLKTPSESSLVLILHVLKELLCSHVIGKITWIDTRDMISDGLTKGAISRIGLMQMSNSGVWQLTHDVMSHVEKHVKHIVSNAHAAEYFAKLFFRPY